MRYELHALGFGELLDTSFRLLRQHFTLWLAVVACCLLPTFLTTCSAEIALGSPLYVAIDEVVEGGAFEERARQVGLLFGLNIILAIVCLTIAGAAIAASVATLYRGGSPSFESALGAGLRLALPLLGTQLLVLFLFAGAGLAALVLMAFLPPVVVGVLTFGLLAFGIYAYIPLILLAPVAALEKRFFLAGWSRCWQLMKGYRSRAWGVLLVASLIYVVVAIPLYFIAHVPWVGNLAALVDQMIIGSYFSFVAVLFYLDLRCRKEGYDLEQLAEAVEEGAEGTR